MEIKITVADIITFLLFIVTLGLFIGLWVHMGSSSSEDLGKEPTTGETEEQKKEREDKKASSIYHFQQVENLVMPIAILIILTGLSAAFLKKSPILTQALNKVMY